MESEEFYDSLEEDSEYDSNNTTIDKEQLRKKNVLYRLEQQPDNIIPFYDKELSRNEINLSKNSSKCSSLFVGKKNVNISKKGGFDPEYDGKLKSNSYLSMFYAKTGSGNELNKPSEQSSTARSNLTSKSFVSCDHSDVNSFYLENSGSSVDNYPTLREIPELALSIPNARIKFQNTPEKNTGRQQRKCRSPQTITTAIPEMGKLGPEVPTDKVRGLFSGVINFGWVKLEQLRRRQQYGKRVSQSNRIKMQEKKAIQNLQQEMRNSRICM